jgi:hypothetical protein
MVNSKLDASINYTDKKDILTNDINKSFNVDSYVLFDVSIELVIGNEIDYSEKSIIYYPVYLIFDDTFTSQIGVFEIMKKDKAKHTNEEGDIDIDTLGTLLPYSFVTKSFLEKYKSQGHFSSHDIVSDEEESDEEHDEDSEQNWVNTYLGETKFKIYDQPPDGDCFFSTIQMAFSKKHTITEMRQLLSDTITKDQFDTYQILFTSNKGEIVELKNKKKELENKISDIRRDYSDGKFKQSDKSKKLEEVKKNMKELTIVKKHIIEEETISNEYSFMDGITSLELLKQKIKTQSFWADSWAISKVEQAFNIKMIILSSDNYDSEMFNKVVQCPEKLDKESRPEYYIIVEHTGNHYKLITFNKLLLFKFDTIPESLKRKIVETCMKGSVGTFHDIEEFRKYADSI